MKSVKTGFTIVELLIVIVVIGILAAISIIAYNNVSDKANDSSVQSDLRSIAQKLTLYQAEYGSWPVGHTQLANSGIKVSKGAYGHHYNLNGNEYNLVYCRLPSGDGEIGLVGRSKSGRMFAYVKGAVSEFSGRWSGTNATCTDAMGVSWGGGDRDWLFELGAWKNYL